MNLHFLQPDTYLLHSLFEKDHLSGPRLPTEKCLITMVCDSYNSIAKFFHAFLLAVVCLTSFDFFYLIPHLSIIYNFLITFHKKTDCGEPLITQWICYLIWLAKTNGVV